MSSYRFLGICLGILTCGGVCVPFAASGEAAMEAVPVAGERLSAWLLRQPVTEDAYPLGLSWELPQQQEAQSRLQEALLAEIAALPGVDPQARARMTAVLQSLPITGRVPVARVDARWLQANPTADPVLQADHVLDLPQRFRTITVLRPDGTVCTVPHESGAKALDYLTVCKTERVQRIDRAWLVQADGRVRDFGIASWNAQAQDEPAPGALIWAPARDSGWTEDFSARWTQFLATQRYENLMNMGHQVSDQRVEEVPGATVTSFRSGARFRDPVYTSNNWGMIGLLQTPTARFEEAGEVRFSYNRIYPYKRYNVFLQPFDWFEAGFRYTDIVNRKYGPVELSGDQTLKDKSIDFRLQLLEETAYFPQVALGMVDFGGTGLFSSEFIVANKRLGNFDWSLGIGWGNMASSSNIRNPLLSLDQKFATRQRDSAQGGTPNTSAFFRGPAALFGGVQYHSPWDQWVFKAEYDGNDYQSQPKNNNQLQRTPLNVGVVYRLHPALDVTLGYERGDAFMLGFTLHTSVAELQGPKVSDQPAPRVTANRPLEEPLWVATVADAHAMSRWGIQTITQVGDTLQVQIEGSGGAHWDDRIARITAVLHRDAPASIETFELHFAEQGVVLSERVIDRDLWVRQNTSFDVDSRQAVSIVAREPVAKPAEVDSVHWERPPSRFGYAIVPSWQQNIGGPDGFILFRAGVSFPLQLTLTENTSLGGAISLNLLDNFDNFKYTGPSNLPRVRTYMREYMTESRLNIPNLQITHFDQWSTNQYYSLYGGYLESMYGGVGGEWLYRPWHSPFAVGVDVNYVRQRDFNQWFGFGNVGTQTGYQVATGHVTGYWDTGWKSVHARVSAGRYLAGDTGATLDLSRTFRNGVTMGAWATRTNVSAEQFGEGSFDKGMYLTIPFDVMTTTRSSDSAHLVYSPLTRDGGARLNRAFSLYGATRPRSERDTGFAPAGVEDWR